jgi:hypothetical protein
MYLQLFKRKEKEYPTVGTVPKSNGKIEET